MSKSRPIRSLLARVFSRASTPRAKRTFGQRVLHEWVYPLTLVLAIMAPIRSSIADWNDVPTGSMRPTILEGDRIYVNKLAFGLRVPFTTAWLARWDEPSRGDIVTFASPLDGTRLVKRVVALPGDRIAMHNNTLYINGEPMSWEITDPAASAPFPGGRDIPVRLAREQLTGRAHAITLTPGLASVNSFAERVIPDGEYFVMGDHRDMSNDSRFIGTVPLRSIYGRCPGVALSVDPQDGYSPRWERFGMGFDR
ncbi:MAG: signal peptidase I [Phycisphaerales bacterium]|nr:signal peptidase I [Phycisphaerales bacterium]